MAEKMSPAQLRDYARQGAFRHLQEIVTDILAILAEFPELRDELEEALGGGVATPEPPPTTTVEKPAETTVKRNRMSPAARRAVSERMTKYWAARRKAKAEKDVVAVVNADLRRTAKIIASMKTARSKAGKKK